MSSCYPTGCQPCDSAIEFPQYPVDNFNNPDGSADLTKTPANNSPALEAGKTYKVTKASESQAFLDTNYKGLTHPVAVNTVIMKTTGEDAKWVVTAATRYCVSIGSEGENKCWVYDKCIPGWRAEGPSASPSRYRGTVDIKTKAPGYENTSIAIAAGDYYIQTVDADANFNAGWGLDALGSIKKGDRIAYNGSNWQRVDPPNVPFAGDALDTVPDPDTRTGGIVKLAAKDQALAGTNKCDAITPYTLQAKITEDVPDFTPTKPNTVTAVIEAQGDAVGVCVNDKNLSLTCKSEAKTSKGGNALGSFTYKWFETTSGSPVELVSGQGGVTITSGLTTSTLAVENIVIDPVNGNRKFYCEAIFVDLYSAETKKNSNVITVTYAQALSVTTQPQPLDLSTNTQGSISIVVGSVQAGLLPLNPTYKWYIDDVEITGATTPDLGYSFSNFTTNSLVIERTAADAESHMVEVQVSGGACDGNLNETVSPVKLTGPAGGDTPSQGGEYGAVGTYTIVEGEIIEVKKAPGVNSLVTGSIFSGGGADGPRIGIPEGTWRVMSFTAISMLYYGSGGQAKQQLRGTFLLLRVS